MIFCSLIVIGNSSQVQAQMRDPLIGEVNSVSHLSDIKPTDWAFEALRSLVERYQCNLNYSDNTYRGNQPITRYEFATGLNNCLNKITEIITTDNSRTSPQDLAIIQRLREDFAPELTAIKERVNALENKVDKIEKQQFSTTTKLRGEAIFTLGGVFGEEAAGGGDLQDNLTLGYRSRLNFNTSFTGKDELRVRLQARNLTPLSGNVTGTNMTRLGHDGNSQNSVGIDDFYYRFPVGDNTRVWVIANGYGSDNIAPTLNSFFQSGSSGALSRFGRFSPLYRLVDGPGVGVQHKFSDQLTFSATYRARNASNPEDGLFGGNNSALGQLTFSPHKNFSVGLTYAHAYYEGNAVDVSGGTGTAFARRPFGNVPTKTNSYGLTSSFRISPSVNLSGWAGLTNAEAKAGANSEANADVWNWAVALAFPDLGKKGNLGGLIFGMPPKVSSNDVLTRKDVDTSFHLEALYRYQLSDRLAITPGVIAIFNPEHNKDNSTQVVGVVRTTFSF